MDKSIFFEKVKEFEGFNAKAYRCPAGVLTIGYGHTEGIKQGDVVTVAEADNLLIGDFMDVISKIRAYSSLLKENELYAIADFIFNVGYERFKKSSVNKYLCEYVFAEDENIKKTKKKLVCMMLLKYVYYTAPSGAKMKSRGLMERRQWEVKVFNYGC